MELGDAIEQAQRTASAALREMARLGIAPTPNHYLVWYCHCSGRHPELSRVLEALEHRGRTPTDDQLAEIYERFFSSARQARLTEQACRRIQQNTEHLLEQVDGLCRDTGSYGQRLADFKSGLTETGHLQQIRQLIAGIIDDTRAMQERAGDLETDFVTTSRQIAALRDDLATALREASTDALTSLANRRHFDDVLHTAADHAAASGEPMCLVLLDIDNFKSFNDTFGHQVGDQVLKVVARALANCIKGRDLAARYGGEEFALILPQTGVEGARAVADDIRRTIAGNEIRLRASGRSLGTITLSAGCAEYVPGEPLGHFLRRADEALYGAKRQGRNRVTVAPSQLPSLDAHTAA